MVWEVLGKERAKVRWPWRSLPPLLTPPLSLFTPPLSLHFHHSSLHLCHSTSGLGSTHVTPRPQSTRRGGWSYIDCDTWRLLVRLILVVCLMVLGVDLERGRLVSILEKCLLSGNEDKLMRVIESVVPSASYSYVAQLL